ncbi:OLC1v1023100C1 [Oldenlandia corymbosa var. corymbosa]|uniref:non-specific serine/threonine protein kinase n=1 Tax=Oldenlandia corymbosa var. corymbosa TaxID=529605 RepID=A0AAV1C1L8_OLDCO|nr:OLC1v1023100C1 [Oldenlandia corymbosa var. corymbosa]
MVVQKRDFLSLIIMNWMLLASIFCSILVLGAQSQTCYPDDLSALKEFAGNLRNGSMISAWSSDSNCCKWEGVVCDDGGRVIKLNVSRKGLIGNISESLGNLAQLAVLDLSHNDLYGEFPPNVSNLQLLETLDLSHNMLSGAVLGSLAKLTSIKALNLSSNSFDGDLSGLGEFPNLVELVISNNSFSGGLDSRLCKVSNNIQFLDLSMNNFTGSLGGLDNCSRSLRQLSLDDNSFEGPLPESIYSMPYLEQLSLSSNFLSDQLSPQLSKLSNLKSLVLTGNMFSGPLPDVFANLTNLEQLVAHSNSLSGKLPPSLAQCSKLKVLDLRNNSFSGVIDLNFTGLPNLRTLDLGSNRFHGPLPDLSNSQKLTVLSLAKNTLQGEVPESYANLSSLVFLSLSNNSLVGLSGALSILQKCRNLTTLILTKNFHGEEIPGNVGGFESLMIFALGNCGLNGQIPSWLMNCSKLEVLDLSWNHLNGSIPPWIGQMDRLFYLDFSNNSLTGEIPESITELQGLITAKNSISSLNPSTGLPLFVKRNQSSSGLQYNQASSFPPSIYLSNNMLNGTISPDIGRLKQLHVLDLSKNSITGTIPSSISDMLNLEVLDLSFNDFYGSIPSSFNKLTFLSKFSVANNHLQGAIPTGGQFLSFPSSSFEGNSGLCGTLISPCAVNNIGMQPASPTSSKKKFGRNSILGVTISIGVGVAIILAFVLLKLSRRDMRNSIEDLEDEMSRPNRLSDAFGPSKLVLFQNSECKDLTVTDILKSTNNFSQSNIVGCGGFGLVYKADLPNGKKAAIKRLSGDCGQIEREFQAEVEALSRAQHKNLVSLQGYCRHGNDRLLIYSYMENGSLDYWLHERIDGSSALRWETRLKIAQGAAHGLAYLHKEPNIVHRDIKTSNILLDDRFEAHLADFGLSRLLHPYDTHVTTDLVGTLGYIPPEYSQTLTATFRGDVYSFGVVLLELLTGRRPVEVCKGKNCRDLVAWVFQMKTEKREEEIFDASIWDKDYEKQLLEVLAIACKCIEQEPRRRPSIDQVVSWLDAIEIGRARK